MNTEILITVAKGDDERAHVTRYIQGRYQALFGTTPGEVQTYIIGKKAGAVVGTIGFELPDKNGFLSIPHGYDFLPEDVHPGVTPENIAQSNRWTSESVDSSVLSIALVYAVSAYAHGLKKYYLWIEQTAPAHRILTRSGLVFHPIPSARVALDRIDEKDHGYYEHKAPLPYIMVPRQVMAATGARMMSLIVEGKLRFDPDVFPETI